MLLPVIKKIIFQEANQSTSVVDRVPETIITANGDDSATASLVSSISEPEILQSISIKSWDKMSGYSDYIRDGLRFLKRSEEGVVMLFESPSSSSRETSFYNSQVYKFHDYPPAEPIAKATLEPLRYSMVNGSAYPSFLREGAPPPGLLDHWQATVPGLARPCFVSEIPDSSCVYAYFPCESIKNHVNDPNVHYHLAGKDAIHLMTSGAPKMLSSTKDRPCIAKVSHGLSSKGIFVIRNDDDEAEFKTFLEVAGNPSYVITEVVDIARNVACHFFINPNGKEITVFGCNENLREKDGHFSKDSYLNMTEQDYLRQIQLPFVMDVAKYCHSLGFWGFCGVDVLFDGSGRGYLVDVNPRVTGSCPSLMVATLLKEQYGFEYGIFRSDGNKTYPGPTEQLFDEVAAFNEANEGRCRVVIFSALEVSECKSKVDIGVYGNSFEECQAVINSFSHQPVGYLRPKCQMSTRVWPFVYGIDLL